MHRFITALILFLCVLRAHADITLSTSNPRVAPGGQLDVKLTITNEGREPLTIDLPSPLHLKLDTGTAVTILDVTPDRTGEIVIEPQQFVIVRLQGFLPAAADG
ncbi:MAG TPA: hypothetical protein VNA21_04295, partial [Steroidobacteraceae bacterium]|nr:hypothetical protein [Steroidobacteraceae bacterium]